MGTAGGVCEFGGLEWWSGLLERFLILGAVGGSKVTFNPFGKGIIMSEPMIDT